MKIKIVLVLFLCFFSLFRTEAQTDFKPLVSIEKIKQQLKDESASLTGIESNFIQNKHLHLLSEKIVSSGTFYYQKPDKICLDYLKPVKYLIVINGNTIKIEADGRTNTFDTASNRLMAQMSSLISACMTGNLDKLASDYELTFYENESLYRLVVVPQGSVRSYMKSIEIFLNKKDFCVHKLIITESTNDYTEYLFSGQKKNIPLPDAKFSTK